MVCRAINERQYRSDVIEGLVCKPDIRGQVKSQGLRET